MEGSRELELLRKSVGSLTTRDQPRPISWSCHELMDTCFLGVDPRGIGFYVSEHPQYIAAISERPEGQPDHIGRKSIQCPAHFR
jgi:hypothetical protein